MPNHKMCSYISSCSVTVLDICYPFRNSSLLWLTFPPHGSTETEVLDSR